MYTQMLTSKYGAELVSFKINAEEKVHQGENCTDENGRIYWKRHWPVLFPTVGKCKKNQTIINGRTYEMQQHGFARDMEFEPLTKLDNFHSYVFRSDNKLIDKYPYEFSLTVTYRTDGNKLTTIYKVVNEGDTDMPFGIGGHPAFKINREELEKVVPLNANSFSNDAIIMKGLKSNKVSLKNNGKTVLTMDFTGFPYLAVWTKPRAPFICIEPWMTTADNVNGSGVFRQKTDILLLPPKQEYECKYIVEFF